MRYQTIYPRVQYFLWTPILSLLSWYVVNQRPIFHIIWSIVIGTLHSCYFLRSNQADQEDIGQYIKSIHD